MMLTRCVPSTVTAPPTWKRATKMAATRWGTWPGGTRLERRTSRWTWRRPRRRPSRRPTAAIAASPTSPGALGGTLVALAAEVGNEYPRRTRRREAARAVARATGLVVVERGCRRRRCCRCCTCPPGPGWGRRGRRGRRSTPERGHRGGGFFFFFFSPSLGAQLANPSWARMPEALMAPAQDAPRGTWRSATRTGRRHGRPDSRLRLGSRPGDPVGVFARGGLVARALPADRSADGCPLVSLNRPLGQSAHPPLRCDMRLP